MNVNKIEVVDDFVLPDVESKSEFHMSSRPSTTFSEWYFYKESPPEHYVMRKGQHDSAQQILAQKLARARINTCAF